MSEVGIVALSILLGMFLLALLASSLTLIWIAFRARKLATDYADAVTKSVSELRTRIDTLDKELTEKISAINGEGLKVASKSIIRCVDRIERAALVMGEMATSLLSDQTVARNNLGPEEYDEPDPEGGRSITQSKTARLDAEAAEDM